VTRVRILPRTSTGALLSLSAGLAVLVLLVPGSGSAAQPRLPASVWGITISGTPAKSVSWRLVASLPRRSRLNTAVVDRRVLSAPGFVSFRSKARKLSLALVSAGPTGATCKACVPVSESVASGRKRAGTGLSVLIHLPSPVHVVRLRGLKRGRAIAVVDLRGGAGFNAAAWRDAIAAAEADGRLDLIASPKGPAAAAGLTAYLDLLGRRKTPAAPPPSSPPLGLAHVWVDGNGGSCVRSPGSAAYVDAQACGSFDAAYRQVRPGDTVLIRGGTYGEQTIRDRADLALGSAPVVFRPAPSESVVINAGFTIYTHDFILDGGDTVGVNEPNRFRVLGVDDSSRRAIDARDNEGSQNGQHRNVIIEDVHTRSVYYTVDHSIIRYSEIGPSTACGDLVLSGDEPVYGWVIEYNLIHDNKGDGCGGAHIDALDLYVVDGVVRGNRIWWCGTQCLFVGDAGSLLIENNMIEETNACGGGCAGPQELAVMGNNIVRYNTIEGDDGYGRDPDRPGTSTVYGNLFLSPYNRCAGGGTVRVDYSHNVFSSRSRGCGSNRKSCTPRFADGTLYANTDRQADYHLAPNDTCALGAGKQDQHPALDLDRTTRPSGRVDAGADER
jgi:hypothetical protein